MSNKNYHTIEYVDGSKLWLADGKYHRDMGLPAVEYVDGSKFWCVDGKLHREGGLPAVEWSNGEKEWHIHGHQVTEEQAKNIYGV